MHFTLMRFHLFLHLLRVVLKILAIDVIIRTLEMKYAKINIRAERGKEYIKEPV